MKLPERILFVGAHCDDIELFAGGLLARAALNGHDVGVLVFSDHAGVVSEPAAARARSELQANVEWLRNRSGGEITWHEGPWLPACQGEFEKRRAEIFATMEHLRPGYDLVVTHFAGDTNQDHAQVRSEAVRVFKAHATLLGGEFPSNDVGDFRPQVYVPLRERELEAKVDLIRRYESQRFGGRPYFDDAVLRGLARMRGSQIRQSAAEAYEVLGRVVVDSDGNARSG